MHATPAVNPQFDSQTKENMTLVKTKFGSECKIGDKMIDAVCKPVVLYGFNEPRRLSGYHIDHS